MIEAADTESQLAGVIAHEISHVALRHGTNQASKASVAQVPLAILGGLLGSNSTGAMLAQLGAGFAVNSVVIINIFEPQSDGDQYSERLQGRGFGQQSSGTSLEQATDQLVEALRQSNRNMRVVRDHETIRVDGESAFSTYLSNDSPVAGGGRETNWLITLQRPEGLLFIVFVAPEREFQSYESTFQQMLCSVRISR